MAKLKLKKCSFRNWVRESEGESKIKSCIPIRTKEKTKNDSKLGCFLM